MENKIYFEKIDLQDLESVEGGAELQGEGCGLWDGKCSSGGCGLFSGDCNTTHTTIKK